MWLSFESFLQLIAMNEPNAVQLTYLLTPRYGTFFEKLIVTQLAKQ